MEEWRDVPGYEGKYQVSISTKEGKCRRLYKNGNIKELSCTPSSRDGRISWNIGKTKQAAVWIALAYPELVQNDYFEGATIDHIDTDRLNNNPSNLRWTDRKGQQDNPLTKEHQRNVKLNRPDQSKWVIKLSTNNEILHFYPSTMQAERETGIKRTAIGACCRGTAKTAGGFKWKYSS